MPWLRQVDRVVDSVAPYADLVAGFVVGGADLPVIDLRRQQNQERLPLRGLHPERPERSASLVRHHERHIRLKELDQ